MTHHDEWSPWVEMRMGNIQPPRTDGVYAVAIQENELLALRYIGKAFGLESRILDHYRGLVRFLPLEFPNLYVSWCVMEKPRVSLVEKQLIKYFNPVGNRASHKYRGTIDDGLRFWERKKLKRRLPFPLATALERHLNQPLK